MAGALTAAIAAAFSGGGSPPVTTDPYFEYTTLLLPGNGTNGAQNNTFLDGSTNNFTITRNGNTTQGTFSPFSQTGWGNYFDGSGDFLSVTATNEFAFGTGDWSIEAWIYLNAYSGGVAGGQVFGTVNGSTTGYSVHTGQNIDTFRLTSNASGTWADNLTVPAGGGVPLNTWTHMAVCRVGANLSIFKNGTRVATTSSAASWNFTGTTGIIGRFNSGAIVDLNGYLSNVRVIKGSSAYSPTATTITVSTTPLTSITGTQLLTCQSNRFFDANTQATAKAIAVTGNTSVVAFSPFNPTASWSAATYGGSGYFDGNADYLTFGPTASIGTSAFTIEAWVYLTATPTSRGLWGTNTSANGGFTIRINSTTQIALDVTGGGGTNFTVPTINLNEWVHIACVRDGSNNTTVFTNGVRSSSGALTVTTNFSYLAGLGLIFPGTTNPPTGYIASARILTGSAVYDPTQTTCTVPTAPLTAISGTQFLCNFTNAGIYDATSKNDLETVGNAQISTTQSKWGGSSISFDGTGDWLLIPDQPPQRIGTGNFTIEMWVYRNSSGTYGLAGKGTGTTGWLVSLNSSNQVVFTYGSSTITSSGTVSATTWTHIAVVREGTSTNQTKIYISGTNDGTGTVSTGFNQTNSMYIGADRTGGSAANAYVQDVRITNYARYTANFTAPTAAFPTL